MANQYKRFQATELSASTDTTIADIPTATTAIVKTNKH